MSKTRGRDSDGIYRRPDSPNYWASFIDASGKRARRSTGTKDRKEADAILAKWRLEAREEVQWGIKQARQFDEMILVYLKEVSTEKRSARSDRINARNLRRYFAGLDVYSWSSADRRSYIRQRSQAGVTNATINRELSLLSSAIKYVNREYDWAVENICAGGMLKEERRPMRWLRKEEAAALLAAAAAEPKAIGLADFITLALHTGMRAHELLFDIVEGVEVGLTWDRVDLKQNLLYLDPRHHKNGQISSVPLNSIAREALLSRARFKATNCPVATYVFCDENGRPIRNMRRSFATACRRAGIGKVRVHDLRHTCASWLVQRGVPIMKVSQLLRHADIKTTMRYAHLAPADSRDAVAALESSESRSSHVSLKDKKGRREN